LAEIQQDEREMTSMSTALFRKYCEAPRKEIQPIHPAPVKEQKDDVIKFMEIKNGVVTWKPLF
jgi:hypothetical protein